MGVEKEVEKKKVGKIVVLHEHGQALSLIPPHRQSFFCLGYISLVISFPVCQCLSLGLLLFFFLTFLV
jgi:hypothetical protein